MNSLIENLEYNSSDYYTKYNLIGEGILDCLSEILSDDFMGCNFLIITDEKIWEHVSSYFKTFMGKEKIVSIEMFPSDPAPYADLESIEKVASSILSFNSIPIAVGSGTINDIVKRAAYICNTKYICIPTAPSVDGFSSSGAAITVNGFKTTLECFPPYYIIADSNIIAYAPIELISAGYGDLVAKLTGGADWIIADVLAIEKIDNTVWLLSQNAARRLFYQSDKIKNRNHDIIIELYKGLIDTGLAIQLYKDSRPASGTEHLISHALEMMTYLNHEQVFHGYKVALGTVIVSAMMNEIFKENGDFFSDIVSGRLMNKDLLKYRLSIADAAPLAPAIRNQIQSISKSKTPDQHKLEKRIENIAANWALLCRKIDKHLPPYKEILNTLLTAGCPTKAKDLNLKFDDVYSAIHIASLIRNRYTILDMASELGILDSVIETILSHKYDII
ncbi:MAG: iron-containing alcohol dehydrogenase [Rectinema sp.]